MTAPVAVATATVTAAKSRAGRRMRSDQRGTAAIDFAFVAPVLFLFLMGTVEMSVTLFLSAALEEGVLQASRYSITGFTSGGLSRQDRVLEILKTYTFGLLDLKDENVTTLVYPNFASIGKPEPFTDVNGSGGWDAGEPFMDVNGNGSWDADMGSAGLGGPGDIVVYKVDYRWGYLTELLEPLLGDITVTGSVAVRNEPF